MGFDFFVVSIRLDRTAAFVAVEQLGHGPSSRMTLLRGSGIVHTLGTRGSWMHLMPPYRSASIALARSLSSTRTTGRIPTIPLGRADNTLELARMSHASLIISPSLTPPKSVGTMKILTTMPRRVCCILHLRINWIGDARSLKNRKLRNLDKG
jgi:hypothetical protein